jgi:protein-tyrosine-phosphatase
VRGTVRSGDLVVAVCDRAYEETARGLGGLGGIGGPKALHWSVPDPAAHDNARAFAETFDNLADRVGRFAASITQEEA